MKGGKRKGRRKEGMKGIYLTTNSAQVKSLEMNKHINKGVDLAQSWTTSLRSVQTLWPYLGVNLCSDRDYRLYN